MNKACLSVLIAALLLPGLWPRALPAQTVQQDFEQGRAESPGEVPLLRGETWQKMNTDNKVSFVWGMGQIIEVEQELMAQDPELRRESFVAKVVEGGAGLTMNEIVAAVDKFYNDNPDQLDLSVVRVIWDTLIKPNLKTGIGGRPLN